jgi:hypothetical protein
MSELLARADPPDPEELLTAAGWLCSGHTVQKLCTTYGRTITLSPVDHAKPEPPAAPDQSRGGFVTARRP